MRVLAICLLSLWLSSTYSFAANPKSTAVPWEQVSDAMPEQLSTRFGQLSLSSTGDSIGKNELLLAGKTLYRGDESTYTHLYQVFQRSDSDVVLIGNNCGGSACSSDVLILAILKKNAAPKLIEDPFLDAYPHEIKFHQAGDTLSFNLGYAEGKLKIAVLTPDNSLSTRLELLPAQALSEEHCKWLYEDALEACVSARGEDTECTEPETTFTGVYMRGLAAMSDYPGYKHDGFKAQCRQACLTGKAPDYSSFGVAVCAKSKTVNPLTVRSKADQALWYESIAKPFLIVRDQPSVTANKLGAVPEGGKVKVLEAKVKADFISGRKGAWVKIEWLDKTGYVFDGFLQKL
ncbi:MAG: SH3 domain-containing protein [Thiothrix sp.]|nr:MAG: SH3 domain-containing protein [Thiothrix sp.]